MINKGIAIRTILLLAVGVLVLGIIVYLFFRTTTGSTLSSTQCMSRVVSWCTICKLKGWSTPCTINGADPTKCECLGPGTNIYSNWTEKCIIPDGYWNFDPSATYNDYQNNPSTYCVNVGVK